MIGNSVSGERYRTTMVLLFQNKHEIGHYMKTKEILSAGGGGTGGNAYCSTNRMIHHIYYTFWMRPTTAVFIKLLGHNILYVVFELRTEK